MRISAIAFCLLGAFWSVDRLEAKRTVALLGIVGDKTVTLEAVSHVASGVERELARNPELAQLSAAVIRAGLERIGPVCVQSPDPKTLTRCGTAIGAELIVHGKLHYEKGLELRLTLTDVRRGQEINALNWDLVLVSELDELSLESVERLAAEATRKLFWDGALVYPLQISDEALDFIGPGIRGEVRTHLSLLPLPRGTEIESAEVTLLHDRRLAKTGVFGILSGVGWLFLPFWDIETKVVTTIRLRTFQESKAITHSFSAADDFRRPKHLWMNTHGVAGNSATLSARKSLQQLGRKLQQANFGPDRHKQLRAFLYGSEK